MAPFPARLLPIALLTAALAAPTAAEAAWLPALKPSAGRKKPAPLAAVAAAAGRARPTAAPSAAPTPGEAASPSPASPLAADPTPDVVHPAVRLAAWRPTHSGAAYGQALEADVSLWQGDWGLGARVLAFSSGLPTLAPFAAGPLHDYTLRRRFGSAGRPALGFAVGYMPAGPVPGLVVGGVEATWPLRGGWLAIDAALRTGKVPLQNEGSLIDARLGLQARAGFAHAGLGWRHLALGFQNGRSGAWASEQLTGPYAEAGLAF